MGLLSFRSMPFVPTKGTGTAGGLTFASLSSADRTGGRGRGLKSCYALSPRRLRSSVSPYRAQVLIATGAGRAPGERVISLLFQREGRGCGRRGAREREGLGLKERSHGREGIESDARGPFRHWSDGAVGGVRGRAARREIPDRRGVGRR